MRRTFKLALLLGLMGLTTAALARESADRSGQVELPLPTYTQLVNQAQDRSTPPPAGYALGQATLRVEVEEVENRAMATVTAELKIRVLEDRWVLVPVLPAGTAVSSVSVDGNSVELVSSAAGLGWTSDSQGTHTMQISYQVDASSSKAGVVLALPVPRAAATKLTATLPGSGLDAAVIPSAGTKIQSSGSTTSVSATLPATSGVQISWRRASKRGHSISRAVYKGSLKDDTLNLVGEFTVELFSNETATLALLPSSVTLSDIKVDGRSAPILVEGDRFATLVKGRGTHKVSASFQVAVVRGQGPPNVRMQIPRIPVSRFELSLPGDKELKVEPASSVTSTSRGATTLATVFVPMTEQVVFSWGEAIPDEVKAELRANASVFHSAHAEEGVLHLKATVLYEVTRGETNAVTLELPPDIQINSIVSASGGVTDWKQNKAQRNEPASATIFLDRHIKGEFVFDVLYERLLGTGAKDEAEKITVPLLRAVGVHRQRGMVALLASKELTLKPVDETDVTKVGENQLPALVRQNLTMTVAHTYKFVSDKPSLVVQATAPERKQGKFNAQVDTLISLGDVTMKGSATIEIHVKSGGIMELKLGLPPNVNLLSLAGPSLRTHKVLETDQGPIIDVQFTQEMEGQFRLDASYERILADGESELVVPTLSVQGSEVEQGRIAVEALTAVEVQASQTEQLSSLDVNELPQQLVLKTTNPILLGYKYVHTEPPYKLALKITRHQEIAVQDATIDQAHYRTLVTREGLAVTTAQFIVRNSRKQFLKVELPEGSEVWSVFVNGKSEKPALTGGEPGDKNKRATPKSVLIKIINSTQGFPVDIIYASTLSKVGSLGTISSRLPRPDMVVTQTRWDLYLPDGVRYGRPDANMDLLEDGLHVSRDDIQAEVAEASGGRQQPGALRLTIPTSGIQYSFEKLYANQSDEATRFSIPYASKGGAVAAQVVNVLGALLIWLGLGIAVRNRESSRRYTGAGILVAGLIMTGLAVGYFGTSLKPALWISVVVAVGLAVRWVVVRRLGSSKTSAKEPNTGTAIWDTAKQSDPGPDEPADTETENE